MTEPTDESYVSLHREIAVAIAERRYRLALSLLDLCEARAVTDHQRASLVETRGSLEAAMRLDQAPGPESDSARG